jgi:4-amino-4-deoxy-L-arabinose transferase-like glycosyltransferase
MSQKTAILLVLILILAGFARILSFSGYCGSDDGAYAVLAYEMANGAFRIGDSSGAIFRLRVGLLAPVALAFKIAGPNEFAMIIYPFILSMLSIILAFLAGRVFFNERAGLIAATIQAILPIDARYASMLWPDLPAAFWVNVGVLLIYYGSNQASRASKTTYAALGGLFLGLAWLTKESIAYVFPFVGIYMVWLTCRQKQNVALLAGASLAVISVLIVESLTYYRYAGDLLYRFHKTSEVATVYWNYGTRVFRNIVTRSVLERIFKDGPIIILKNRNFGWVPGVAMLAIGYAAFRRLHSFLFPGLWFLSLAFMFNFGSTSFQFYEPFLLIDRYLYPLLLPAVVLTAGLINLLIPSRCSVKKEIDRERLFWGGALAACIIFICLFDVYGNIRTGIGSPVERRISHMLGPGDPIYTDSRTASVLNFFWKYPKEARTRDFEGMGINDVPRGVYVLINRNRIEFLNSLYGNGLPKFYENIPNDWLLKWGGNRAELYWVPMGANPLSER